MNAYFKSMAKTVLAFGAIWGVASHEYGRDKEVVTIKETVPDGNDRVVKTDHGTFWHSQSTLRFRFNSESVQGSLRPDCTYELEVTGYRIPLVAPHRTIRKAEHIPTRACPVSVAKFD